MSCRQQILEVARDLARRTSHGRFAMHEILAEMHARETPYTDGAIYMHVASVMRKGAVRRRGAQFDDLERVGRGVYRLVEQERNPAS